MGTPKMDIIDQPSPNHDARAGQTIDMLVLHYTGMQSLEEAVVRLTNPDAKVSAHYLVAESGEVFRMVDEKDRAWHAGVSFWRGETNINARSIGVEIENPGHAFGYRPFPEVQISSLILLCRKILRQHTIPSRNVVGHSDVAPARKEDPGELFDWPRLAENGIGFWPKSVSGPVQQTDFEPVTALSTIGYDVGDIRAALMAFQRHFYPSHLTGEADTGTCRRLARVIESI